MLVNLSRDSVYREIDKQLQERAELLNCDDLPETLITSDRLVKDAMREYAMGVHPSCDIGARWALRRLMVSLVHYFEHSVGEYPDSAQPTKEPQVKA